MPIGDVGDAMREMRAGSKHIRSRKQAIAVGLAAKRRARGGAKKRSQTGTRKSGGRY